MTDLFAGWFDGLVLWLLTNPGFCRGYAFMINLDQ